MRLIESKVELLPQPAGLEGVYKQIEIAGRTCYKSEDKITPDSAKEFVDRMIKNGHTAMLEHGTVYLKVPVELSPDKWWLFELANNKYTQTFWQDEFNYVTTNFRVLVENDWMEALKYVCEPTEHHAKRISARFTCDRGVSHELVRHKKLCVA